MVCCTVRRDRHQCWSRGWPGGDSLKISSAAAQLSSLWKLVLKQLCYLWLEIDAFPAPPGHPVHHYNCRMEHHVTVLESKCLCKAPCEECLPLLLLIADLKLSSDSSCRH